MPPKRAFSLDDFNPDSNGPGGSPNSPYGPPKRRKTSFFPNNEWRRPAAPPDEWWAVSEPEWDRMPPAMKMNWTHVGRIMETEEGEPAAEACEMCLAAGAARACWVYTREAMRRYGFKTHVCARCRATANVCSLNPFFRNSVGLRDNRPPPLIQSSSSSSFPPPQHRFPSPGSDRDPRDRDPRDRDPRDRDPRDRHHRFASPGSGPPDRDRERYRTPTPPGERHGRFPQSPVQSRHRIGGAAHPPPPSPGSGGGPPPRERERDRFPPHDVRHRSPPPSSSHHYHHHSHSQPSPMLPPLSVEALAARIDVVEQKMEAMRDENRHMQNENGFLRWRITELEGPAGALLEELDAKKPPGTQAPQPPALMSQQSASAVETLVMEESIASELREQGRGGKEEEERRKVVEEERRAEEERRREAEERRRVEEEERRAEEEERRAEEEERRAEEERRREAELAALRTENGELARRVVELEKGHELTTSILRDMYYALG